jgi:hypothetical protein
VPLLSVYLGIDVSCAVGKALPLCVLSAGPPIMPLAIPKRLARLIPRGVGNKEITAALPFQEVAQGALNAIAHIGDEMGWRIERIGIDAPAAPPATGTRTSEAELARLGCRLSKHPPRLPGREYARGAPLTCASAARQQPFPTPTKSGCCLVFSFLRV